MKVAPLLVQYLLTYKRLDLPGIGSFLLNENASAETDQHKHDKQAGLENLSFESNVNIRLNPGLVQFIAEQAGKIKALASADLDSHLALAQQFLNIGNPFLFEGIGILEKMKSGEYALLAGAGLQERGKESSSVEKQGASESGEFHNDYKKIFYSGKVKMKWHNPFIVVLIIAGLALAVWGGYTVYKKTTAKNNSQPGAKNKNEESIPVRDTAMFQKDSAVIPAQHISSGAQKFILEICNAKRAYERYGKLKTFQWNVQLETKDSLTYKLFMLLPVSAADTSRIIDSLSRLNGRKVFIEH